MAKVILLQSRVAYTLFILSMSGSSSSCYSPSLDSLFPLNSVQRLEDVEVQREKFERSKNYFSRVENFKLQQPRYHRQFGNGGISGRVPYKFKREKHLYRCENR